MQFRKRLKAFFNDPRKKLAAILPELRQLRQDLYRASETRDPLTEIVHFFNSVSRWHDRGLGDLVAAFQTVNYGQYDEVLEKLQTLQRHFENAGRDQYGMNRTKRGETVTADKVFLGGVYGLFTHPIPFWKQRKDSTESCMERPNAYDVVSQQARSFMASHIFPLAKIIDELEAITQPVAA